MDGFQSLQPHVRRVLHTLWKRRWHAVAAAWVVAGLAVAVVPWVPNRYEASAKIYVDTKTVLKPLMEGLAYIPDIDQQVAMLARTLVSRPNVERLMDRPELGFRTGGSASERERAIARLTTQIKVAPAGGAANLYSITYRDTDSARAKRLVDATLDLFVNASSLGKKRDSEEASQFIDEQIKAYEAKLIDAENRLKEFKVRHFGTSGVATQDFFSRMSVLSEEVSRLRIELSSAEQSREAYRRELASENPQLPSEGVAGAAATAPSELDTRIENQKKLLDEMLRRYTDEHPDVVSTRRVIAQLERQREAEAQAKAAAFAAGKRVVAATSPVYQKLRVSLAETEAQVASLRSQLSFKQARLDEARQMAGRVPQIEAELAQLNRDYDIINKNYQGLVARRESASLGIKLDESSRLAEFRVVEPPLVSPSPVFPARAHLALIAAALALAVGVALPLVLDYYLWPTFRGAAELQKATGRPVLGSITLTAAARTGTSTRTQVFGVAAAFALLLATQAVWVLWLAGRMNIG